MKNKELANFKVGVDNVIFSVDLQNNHLFVLLVKRLEDPYQGYWTLPGTLVREGEALEKSAYRILDEKISVNNLYLEQLYTFGEIESNLVNNRYLSVSYFALVRLKDTEILMNNHHNTVWHNIKEIPPLAFNHQQILDYGYQRLKNKLEYSTIAFDVLPETFTLNDIYQLYITILGENFADYSNFRSRLLKLGCLEDTGIKISKGAGRPATLYRFNGKTSDNM
jgi:8-oxo-dGTP diphosphatase